MSSEHFDVVIVGAGLSGIGAAVHLKSNSPDRSYVILEGREAIGGTWDLFRYPGIRSDSDMYTLGYRFKPWTSAPIATAVVVWSCVIARPICRTPRTAFSFGRSVHGRATGRRRRSVALGEA